MERPELEDYAESTALTILLQVLTMIRALFLISVYFVYFHQSESHPIDIFPKLAFTAKSERTWLWGWSWGAESTVSVVDRSPIVSFPSRPAAFGAELGDPLLGYVIPLSSFTEPCSRKSNILSPPNWGCPPLCVTGPHEPDPTETWIALVQRGECEFVNKVREAQRLGAKAVVVGGNDPEISGYPDTLVNMYSQEDASDVKIASTFIKFSDYTELSALIATSNTSHAGLRTLSLLITAEYSAWEWYSPIITFIIILLLPSVLTFITLLIHRIRAARAAQRERAPEDVVRNLPWRVWTGTGWEKHEGAKIDEPTTDSPPSGDREPDVSAEQGEEGESSHALPLEQPWFETQMECAICLSEFGKGDKVRVLPCHHIFHLEEVDEWLIQRKKLCPVCKADVTRPFATDQPHPDSPASDHPSIEQESSAPSQPTNVSPVTERTPLLHASDRTDVQT